MQRGFATILIVPLFAILTAASAALATPTEKQVNLKTGVKLDYVVDGPRDGAPIIFLHGYTDSSHSWSSTTPFLADTWRTYALDQRGHGDSEKPLYGYTIAQYAEDVIAFMDELGIEQTVLVGHSMGSVIAHQVASAHPERVTRLVLVGSAPTVRDNPLAVFLWEEIIGLPEFVDPVPEELIREFQTGPNPVDPDFFEKVVEESSKLPARVWKAALRAMLTDDHSFFLGDVSAPTLVIWGTQDVFFSLAHQQALVAAIPDATLIIYDGAGHNTQWEEPQRVAEDIRAFLE